MRAAALAPAALHAIAPAANVTFPGANGNLVVSVDTCEFNPHLRAGSPGGAHLGTLTEPCRYDVRATIMRIRATGGRRRVVRRRPAPHVEEGEFHLPELAWQPLMRR